MIKCEINSRADALEKVVMHKRFKKNAIFIQTILNNVRIFRGSFFFFRQTYIEIYR